MKIINTCGYCARWWCNDIQELTGFCLRDLRCKYYEDHACEQYEDKERMYDNNDVFKRQH